MKAPSTLCLLFATLCVTQAGLNIETLKYCCSLGANYANSGLKCTSFQTPIAGVQKEDESSCINSIEVCCRNERQESECNSGINDARSGAGCSQSDGFAKDCCNACDLGIVAGRSQQNCQNNLGLGSPYDKSFMDCCNEYFTTTSTTTSSSSPATREATTPRSTTPSYNDSPLPPIENVCDIGDVCAQICIPTGDSYRCDCNRGFTLMADGISCKPDKRASNKGDRCALSNPCDHQCTDTGLAIKCSCYEGFELAKDKRTCKDINECALGTHECDPGEECVNEDGGYYCDDPNYKAETDLTDNFDNKCPTGYKLNFVNMVCDDIDECEFDIICPRPKACINTMGSFKCEGEDRPDCPPGFYYKAAIETCTDIDECVSGQNDCNKESQICINTVGNYTCVDKVSKKSCPPGFKKNPYTQNCDDVDECLEDENICGPNEKCVNQPGGHTCVPQGPKPPPEPTLPPIPTEPLTKSTTSTTTTSTTSTSTVAPTTSTTTTTPSTTTTTTTTTSKPVTCPSGYRYNSKARTCLDIDECEEDEDACDSSQDCYNAQGSYVCTCKTGFTKDFQTGACIDINECQIGTDDCRVAERCDNTIGSYLCARQTGCGTGYTLNYANGLCEDDDECTLGTHNCNSLGPNFKCRNTLGSYRCEIVRPKPTPAPVIPFSPAPAPNYSVNVAALPTHVYPGRPVGPEPSQSRPEPSYPSRPGRPEPPAIPDTQPINPGRPEPRPSSPARPDPHPVYPGRPEPQPSSPARPDSRPVYPGRPEPPPNFPARPDPPPSPTYPGRPYPIYPVLSGTLKKCLPGYRMNARGVCEDVDECESNPCGRGQKCLNFNGRYQCISALQCKIGYELDEPGTSCIDVNECTRGIHKCNPTQICKNGQGFYTCECPPGHHLNRATQLCEDIDECKYYMVCSSTADCINTIGSYKCRCKNGFREKGNICDDVDECRETSRLCEHKCINIWGSFRCACESGFTLNADNRTCTDIDECERFKDEKLCVGPCQNTPGSYRCTCPTGYRLGNGGHTCVDIDECQQRVCSNPSDICLNTRGGYKCFAITCPANYFRDPQHKGRCKRPPTLCDPRDVQCILMPEQYTYHYITLVSNMPISSGQVQFFQMNGPKWVISRAEFTMKVANVLCPLGVERVNERFFRMVKSGHNIMQLYLVRSIQGPQEVELRIEMNLFQNNVLTSNVVSHIYIVVSQYTF